MPVAWCGADQAATERIPDAVNGFQWHVVYAFPADGADNFATLASGIATDLASIDAWWNGQDGSRRIRFDLFAFPGCPPGLGQLDLSRAQLPNPAAHFQPLADRLERIVADLNAAPFAFRSPDKKYLVYYDGPVDDPKTCGQGNAGRIDGGANSYALVYLGACGPQAPGDGDGQAALTAVHEMTHVLDAVVGEAPHVCESGHVCDSASDLLKAKAKSSDTLSAMLLDVGRDDYYGHAGNWWDIQDSRFLVRVGGPDVAAPTGPQRFDITSDGAVVTLSWSKAGDDVGPIGYRVYADGVMLAETRRTKANHRARAGQTIVYGLRAADAAGFLGPLLELRFRVGFGLVDAGGKLVKDTVPPPRVTGLRAQVRDRGLVMRWNRVRDPGGIKGYLVERNRKRFRVIKGTTISVPAAKARGTWTVRAIDRTGNIGLRLQSIRLG